MKQIGGIIKLFIALVALGVSFSAFKDYFGGAARAAENYSKLISEGETAVASLDSTYMEFKSTGTFYVSYTFEVEGDTYGGQYKFTDIEAVLSPVKTVQYLASDPTINSMDPQAELEEAKKAGEQPIINLLIGIVGALYGIYSFRTGISKLLEKREDVPVRSASSNKRYSANDEDLYV